MKRREIEEAGTELSDKQDRLVGSSIAVSPLLGTAIVLNLDEKSSTVFLFLPLGIVAIIYVIFNAFMFLYDQSGAAWPSHIIGFLTGLLVGTPWRGKGREIGGSERGAPFPATHAIKLRVGEFVQNSLGFIVHRRRI